MNLLMIRIFLNGNIFTHFVYVYTFKNVYNTDEFRLFYIPIPDKSFVFENEEYHCRKISEEHFMVLACINFTGN